ncbi:hypothetical protein BGY98DRAFT_1094860 [Russula aff. rugulosa BPL654]|nr:hypothetical protein BGY98DRAFT_1094860 [Russula aff. rugulosa BPL654]
MTTIYQTAVPSGGGEPNSDLDTTQRGFDVYEAYQCALADEERPFFHSRSSLHVLMVQPGIVTPLQYLTLSLAGTMFELVQALNDGAETLKKRVPNPIGLTAGCELFIGFVTLFPHDPPGKSYSSYAVKSRTKIAELVLGFIKDDSVILTHSYSRVVTQALLHAHTRKRISVYVTEARPRCLGLKTYETLTAAGIPCTVVLDSAVAYVMDKVDFVLVGSEAVVESGGLVNAVGSNQMAIIAKAENKPFYALAESYKFHRLFPLSQYDLPTHNSGILSFAHPTNRPAEPSQSPRASPQRTMTSEQMERNPDVDYTTFGLVPLLTLHNLTMTTDQT